MSSRSPWRLDDEPPPSRLVADLETEVCVVGAGISGLSVAYLLAREGRRVVVIDDGPIGGGETGATSAHLSSALDDRYYRLEQLHGREGARLAAESHTAAIAQIEEIVWREKISCDFQRVDGFLFEPPGGKASTLTREMEAARRAGLADVELASRLPEPFPVLPALRFPRQAQFEPLRYLAGLARAVRNFGCQIYTSTHAAEISGGSHPCVKTSGGPVIHAAKIVVATNTPVNHRLPIHTKQASYRTYVVGLRMPAGHVPMALYWDNANPYHYVRVVPGAGHDGGDLLIVGGEDHKTGQGEHHHEEKAWANLEKWARAMLPGLGEVECHWSGQVLEPVDSLAFIGHSPFDGPNVFLVTGDSGHGLTHGTIAGLLITDLIAGRKNPWEKLYDPGRTSLLAIPNFARENLNALAQYADLLTPGEVTRAEEIAPGEGAIIRHGLRKIACYRDEEGALHLCSAICPHLEGVVRWNEAEKSWDCPCHGSRFDCFGKVINGPANSDLKPVESGDAGSILGHTDAILGHSATGR